MELEKQLNWSLLDLLMNFHFQFEFWLVLWRVRIWFYQKRRGAQHLVALEVLSSRIVKLEATVESSRWCAPLHIPHGSLKIFLDSFLQVSWVRSNFAFLTPVRTFWYSRSVMSTLTGTAHVCRKRNTFGFKLIARKFIANDFHNLTRFWGSLAFLC